MTTYTFVKKPISIFQSKSDVYKNINRRVFITVTAEDLRDVPAEFFSTKVSQSKAQHRQGKLVFKHFSYKLSEDTPWSDLAPKRAGLDTPVEQLKEQILTHIANQEGVQMSMIFNLAGKFVNIKTSEGDYSLYDDEMFAENDGRAPYYLKKDTIANIDLESAMSAYGPYYRVKLSTEATPDEAFVRQGRAKVWGQEDEEPTMGGFQAARPETDAANEEGDDNWGW